MKRTRRICLFAASALTIAFSSARGADGAEALAVVVNPSSNLSVVSLIELQRYFKAEKTKAPDGTKLIIIMQDTGRPERSTALKTIYKMSEAEYTNFFVEATFTGAVTSAPKSFPSGAVVKKFVAATPGALGYIRSSELDDTVKAIKVDGKATSDPDYSLKLN